MLVMLTIMLQSALLLTPQLHVASGTGQAAPTPEPRAEVAAVPAQALLPVPSAPAQDAGVPAGARTAELPKPPAELPPLEAPPALPAAKVEALGREISKLRATNPAALQAAKDAVTDYGRAAIPALAKAATTTNAGQMEALVACLTTVTDYRDRDFVEASLGSPLPVMRRFAARKVGEYALPLLVDQLTPLLQAKEPEVRLEATLALLANGREDGLAIAAAVPDGPDRERVLAVLPRIAGQGRHQTLAEMLRIDPQREKEEPEVAAKERLAAVVLLHAIGDDAAQSLLVDALGDKHNVVQREAINALRDLLEHQGPMDKSSIFQQINEVKRLKGVWEAR